MYASANTKYPILTPVPYHYRRVMIFDVETTGLIPRGLNVRNLTPQQLTELPYIIQISWVVYNVVSNRIESTYNAYIDIPKEVPIIDRITEITGITRTTLDENGKDIVPVLEAFYKTYVDCDMVIAHNIEFDQKLIGIEIERNTPRLIASPTAVCPIYSIRDLFTTYFNAKHCVDLYCTMMATIDLCGLPQTAKPLVVPLLPLAVEEPVVSVQQPKDTPSSPISTMPKPENQKPENQKPSKQWAGQRPKYPRLSELHQVLFGSVPENLHNSMMDVLVCLRCFLKIRCCLEVPDRSFDRMVRNALRVTV
jgi:DNA polymerase III epsilon subunit-like protein